MFLEFLVNPERRVSFTVGAFFFVLVYPSLLAWSVFNPSSFSELLLDWPRIVLWVALLAVSALLGGISCFKLYEEDTFTNEEKLYVKVFLALALLSVLYILFFNRHLQQPLVDGILLAVIQGLLIAAGVMGAGLLALHSLGSSRDEHVTSDQAGVIG